MLLEEDVKQLLIDLLHLVRDMERQRVLHLDLKPGTPRALHIAKPVQTTSCWQSVTPLEDQFDLGGGRSASRTSDWRESWKTWQAIEPSGVHR